MKLLKVLLYIVLGVAALFAGAGLFARKNYHIERSLEINAPREIVFEQVRSFKNFEKWSPWHGLDPDQKTAFEGTDGEVGAVYRWEGNSDVGKGVQTMKAIRPDRVDIEVRFTEPWESTSPTFFTLEEKGEKTRVTWGFDMHVAFPWNAFAMLTDVDAGVGKDYERGLGNLKKLCEGIAHKTYRGYEVLEAELPAKYYAGVRKTIAMSEISAFYAENTPQIMENIQKGGLQIAGPRSSLTWLWDEKNHQTDIAAAFPVGSDKKLGAGIATVKIGGGKALTIDHYGPYDSIGNAHYAMDAYMLEKKLRNLPPVIEEYVTDPAKEPDTLKWLTKVIYFVEPLPLDSVGVKK
jgi:effector-binding domain-containing protein/uncharacterized protein YndB with AHSA1/START domain